jgi:hypothetical protein
MIAALRRLRADKGIQEKENTGREQRTPDHGEANEG